MRLLVRRRPSSVALAPFADILACDLQSKWHRNLVLRAVGVDAGTGEASFHFSHELKLLVAEKGRP